MIYKIYKNMNIKKNVIMHVFFWYCVLTFPDPLNVLGNATFVQRGNRQCWENEHDFLQLEYC